MEKVYIEEITSLRRQIFNLEKEKNNSFVNKRYSNTEQNEMEKSSLNNSSSVISLNIDKEKESKLKKNI